MSSDIRIDDNPVFAMSDMHMPAPPRRSSVPENEFRVIIRRFTFSDRVDISVSHPMTRMTSNGSVCQGVSIRSAVDGLVQSMGERLRNAFEHASFSIVENNGDSDYFFREESEFGGDAAPQLTQRGTESI